MVKPATEVVSVGSLAEAMHAFSERMTAEHFTTDEMGGHKFMWSFRAEHDFCRAFEATLTVIDGQTESPVLTCLVPVPAGRRAQQYSKECIQLVHSLVKKFLK